MLNIHNIKRSISHTYCFKHYTLHILYILFTVIRFYFTSENTEIMCTPIQKQNSNNLQITIITAENNNETISFENIVTVKI